MPDTTPVTDDDLDALDLANMIEKNPHSYSDTYRGAARAIRAHVPAPPATLADELREYAKNYATASRRSMLRILADRVEAVEKENRDTDRVLNEAWAERDEARASLRRESEALSQWMEFYRKAEEEVRGLNAEVERLTSIIKNHPDSEYVFAPGGVIGKPAKVNLDRMNLPDAADVPEGEPWLIHRRGQLIPAISTSKGDVNRWMTFSLGVACSLKNESINLVSRLVPDVRRVIDRPEDLDALPEWSVVLDQDGEAWQKSPSGNWVCGTLVKTADELVGHRGPVTVIHEPMVDSAPRS